jgi:hypothetical protein
LAAAEDAQRPATVATTAKDLNKCLIIVLFSLAVVREEFASGGVSISFG